MSEARVALKVDCDTFEGTRDGIPRLLDLFARTAIRATFFFVLGPDRSGRAALRVFTQRGFLAKMLRSGAVRLYGPRTMLYGTLLPAPMIGDRLADTLRSVAAAGHEVGIHGWDHVRWHDRVDRMTPPRIEADYGRAHEVFARIFGTKARASAAPGWHATDATLCVQESYGLLYASDTRGGSPFHPRVSEPGAPPRTLSTVQIPTTLPTLDELLGRLSDEEEILRHYEARAEGTQVHTIHTEVEGMAYLPLFERQIARWRACGVTFPTLEELAREVREAPRATDVRRLDRTTLPGRGGLVTSSIAVPARA